MVACINTTIGSSPTKFNISTPSGVTSNKLCLPCTNDFMFIQCLGISLLIRSLVCAFACCQILCLFIGTLCLCYPIRTLKIGIGITAYQLWFWGKKSSSSFSVAQRTYLDWCCVKECVSTVMLCIVVCILPGEIYPITKNRQEKYFFVAFSLKIC